LNFTQKWENQGWQTTYWAIIWCVMGMLNKDNVLHNFVYLRDLV